MLYGYGCGVVNNPNYLKTSLEVRFFWLLLSTMKCNRVPFTHIYEWKRHSPSSRPVGSSSLFVVIVTIEVGFALMICLLPVCSELDS
jgi:hypothetical protein